MPKSSSLLLPLLPALLLRRPHREPEEEEYRQPHEVQVDVYEVHGVAFGRSVGAREAEGSQQVCTLPSASTDSCEHPSYDGI